MSEKTEAMLANFYPDQEKGSVWQFEQIKCDADYAHYVILHKRWIWMRREGFFGEHHDNLK